MTCPGCQQEHADGGICPPVTDLASSDSLVGKSLGDYGLVRELGRGSSGVVFLAEHLATGLNVAIKLAHRHSLGDPAVARRMSLEAHFANQIALESVVNVFDFNDEDPVGPYLVMEYLQGETFLDLAAQRVPSDEALRLLIQVAEALGEAHERNIVHAALKPSNILRVVSERKSLAKLLPFGVATGARVEGEEPGDRLVTHLGAPELRAPEQTRGAPADPRMDVYSLGAIAYLLATGRAPFSAPSEQALERAHAEVVPSAPHRVDARVSRGWSAAIMRALEKSPERRFRSGKEFAEALRAAPAQPDPVGSAAASQDAQGSGAVVADAEADAFVVTMPAPLSQRSARPTLYPGVTTPRPATPAGSATTPAPQPNPGSAPVAGGLSGSFGVTTPSPQKPPQAVSAGLGAGFVTTTPPPQKPPPAAPVAAGLGAGFVTTTPPPQKPPPATAPVSVGLGAGFVTTTPPPQKPPPAAPVAAGLGAGFVTTTPPPQKPPPAAPVAAGLSDSFVVTTPGQQKAAGGVPPATLTAERAEAFVTSTPAPLNQAAPLSGVTPAQPSAPAVAAPTPAQGLVLQATIGDEKGQPLGNFACTSVTRAGLIVCTAGPLPALLSRVKLTFTELSALTVEAQVVHHVTSEQAQQWKMSAGYGVQFGALSAEQRQALEGVHLGLRPPETPSGLAKRPNDPTAEEVLKRFTAERATDGYAMLTISKGAPFDAIRDRVREAKRALEGISTRPLSLAQQKALEEARTRLEEVGKVLGGALSRMEYDAERGNFEGVARCISAGLSVSELEGARLRFLKAHPGIAGKSHGSILAGQTLEARTHMAQALEAYADALRVDPLNLTAQQRYWAVKRQLEKA
ncbi:MAG: protein kinase [Archangium sp.]|nr:protein kinase [Archangium sp.]